MAKNNLPLNRQIKSPVQLIGLFCICILISACQTPKTPEQVSTAFWIALTIGDLETAKKYATRESQQLITDQDARPNATLSTGKIVIDGNQATVETNLSEQGKVIAFNTSLLKEGERWKVDFQQTRRNISAVPLSGIFKSLENIGETLNNQLEQQMPLLEKQIESFGEELKKQLEEFSRYLEDPKKWEKEHPIRDDSI